VMRFSADSRFCTTARTLRLERRVACTAETPMGDVDPTTRTVSLVIWLWLWGDRLGIIAVVGWVVLKKMMSVVGVSRTI